MSYLEDLLPEISTDSLNDLLARLPEDRPTESLFFEFKSEATPRGIAKAVAAFANKLGGFIFIGAVAVDGRLDSLPGVPKDREWPKAVADNLIGHVSPLPVWEPYVVPLKDSNNVVVVIKVDESRRTPHIITTNGLIYQRSPGGTSDPIRDRATLDDLVNRGRDGNELVTNRARTLVDSMVEPGSSAKWTFSIASVPLPYRSSRFPDLLTKRRHLSSPALFNGVRLDGKQVEGTYPREDAIELDWGRRKGRLFEDGALVVHESQETSFIPVLYLCELLQEVLFSQRGFPMPVYEAFVLTCLRGGDQCDIYVNEIIHRHFPNPWGWSSETSILEGSVKRLTQRFRVRLLRSAGMSVFDHEKDL